MKTDDLHIAEFADLRVRFFRGGNEAIFGITIDKHVELLLGREVGGNVATRQKDFAQLAAVEVETGLGSANNREQIAFADSCHINTA